MKAIAPVEGLAGYPPAGSIAFGHAGERAEARIHAFRLVRDLQDGVPVSAASVALFVKAAQDRGWPEVVRAGLYVDVVRLSAAEQSAGSDAFIRSAAVTRLLEQAELDGDAVMAALALAERALMWTSDDPASSVTADSDIARAAVMLEAAEGGALERVSAHNACALAYSQRDLWELETDQYAAAELLLGDCHPDAALSSVILFNRAEAQLNWAAALREIGDFEALGLHCTLAGSALTAAETPAMPASWRHELAILRVLLAAMEERPFPMDVAALPIGVTNAAEFAGHLHLALALALAGQHGAAEQAERAVAALDPVRQPMMHGLALCVAAEIEATAAGHETAGLRATRRQSRLRWAMRLSTLAVMRSLMRAERLSVEHDLLSRQAYLDDLTGLGNRRALERYIEGLAAQRVVLFAMVLIDVDRFKDVNDRHGHAVGDKTLVRLAGLLATAVRAGDLAVRLGGDEFVVLLASTDRLAAIRRAEAVRAAIASHPWDALAPGLAVTASVGLACGHPLERVAMAANADAALYRSKAAGGNRVSETFSDHSRHRRGEDA